MYLAGLFYIDLFGRRDIWQKIARLLKFGYFYMILGGGLMAEKEIGKVSHYFTNIGVCVIDLTGGLKVGDKIHIKGATTDVNLDVKSMQVEHDEVDKAKKGQSIGLKVPDRVREHDVVYKVS